MKKIFRKFKNIIKNKYVLAYIIPLVINIMIFTILGVYPFGDNMHIRSDAYHQYVVFLDFMRTVIYKGDISQLVYSFSNGFGHGGMLFLAYYLLSPFNILAILLPFLNIEIVFMLIMMVKISCLGLSFYYFLEKFEFNLGKAGYMFSAFYSFMAFTIVYNINIMWLDSIVLMPILLVSLKDMFKANKILKFTLLMLTLYVSNFYMAFMVCIFIVLNLLLSLIFKKEVRIDFKRKIKLFTLSTGISILLFGVIMIPVISELVEFSSNSSLSNNVYGLFNNLTLSEVVAKLFMFSFDTFFSMVYSHPMAPYSYFGLFPLVLAIIYIMFSEKNSDKKILISITLIVIISFLVPILNLAWHGFDIPTGFDYRYSFILSFVGIIMGCKGFQYVCENTMNKKEIIKLLFVILILFIFTAREMSLILLISNLVFVLVYISMILLNKNINLWKEKIAIVVVFEIVINALLLNMMVGAQIGTMTKDEYFGNKSVEEIKRVVDNYTDSNYRVLIEKDLLRIMNSPMDVGYKGTSSFNSSINSHFIKSLCKLGLYKYSDLAYTLDSNYLTDAIFSVKYIISDRELDLYKKIDELTMANKKVSIYENPYAMPIGYVSSKDIASLDELDLEENFLKIMSSISGEEYSKDLLYKKYYPKKVTINNKEITANEDGEYILKKDMVKNISKLKIEYPKGADLTVRVGKNSEVETLLSKKGKDGNGDCRNRINYCNNISKEEPFIEFELSSKELELSSVDSINLGKLEGLELNKEYLKDILEDINANNSTEIKFWENGHIKLTVNNKNNNNILITTIPYADSWKAKVNGKEVDLINLELGSLGLKLEEGINNIELKYIPKGLKIGAFMTFAGILILLVRIKKFE